MKAILALTAAIAFAVSPLQNGGFDGFAPEQFPVPQADPPAQPAGWAVSIWGLIYLWLLAGTGLGLVRRADDRDWDAHRWPLIASLTLGAAWLPTAQISALWATVLIWGMLVTALWALIRCGRHDRLWQQAPVAVYAGWLTAAACVALALMLAGHGIMGETAAALVALVLALVIAAAVLALRPGAPDYAAAVIWALIGVAAANFAPLNAPVLGLSLAGAALLGWLGWRARRG